MSREVNSGNITAKQIYFFFWWIDRARILKSEWSWYFHTLDVNETEYFVRPVQTLQD